MIDEAQEQILRKLRQADGLDFATLVRIAKLNPAKDLREADLRGVDFGASDLSGFDFTGADLTGAKLDRARTDGATFDDAVTEGVVWPILTDKRYSRESAIAFELYPFQLEALNRILKALLGKKPRGLLSMPRGTGRSAVIERLIEVLDGNRRYRNILLVVESVAEREQYWQQLYKYDRFRHGTHVPSIIHNAIGVEVVTVGKLRNVLGRYPDSDMHRLTETDLIIAIGEPSQLLNTARELKKFRKLRALIGFTSLPHSRVNSRIEQQIRQLKEQFGEPLFIFDVKEASSSGLLSEAVVEQRRPEFRKLLKDGEKPLTGELVNEIVSDLNYQIMERFQYAQCLVICQNVKDVELIALRLAEQLARISSKQVLAVTSRTDQRGLWSAIDGQGAILVTTAAMALGSLQRAIRYSELTAVLTAIEFPLADHLQFRPVNVNRSREVILDYTGSFNKTPEAVPEPGAERALAR